MRNPSSKSTNTATTDTKGGMLWMMEDRVAVDGPGARELDGSPGQSGVAPGTRAEVDGGNVRSRDIAAPRVGRHGPSQNAVLSSVTIGAGRVMRRLDGCVENRSVRFESRDLRGGVTVLEQDRAGVLAAQARSPLNDARCRGQIDEQPGVLESPDIAGPGLGDELRGARLRIVEEGAAVLLVHDLGRNARSVEGLAPLRGRMLRQSGLENRGDLLRALERDAIVAKGGRQRDAMVVLDRGDEQPSTVGALVEAVERATNRAVRRRRDPMPTADRRRGSTRTT